MDIVAWWATVHGVTKSGTRLSDLTSTSALVLERSASLVAQLVKNLPAVRETWVPSLGREDPLEKDGTPLQHSCLENPMDGGPW